MMIRFRDLEVPVAVGLLLLSAALGITGWNGQPSNGKDITGVQIGTPPVILEPFSECLQDRICLGTLACGTLRDDQCAGEYEWKPTDSDIQTNCFYTGWIEWCAQPAQGPQVVTCARATKICKRFINVKVDLETGIPWTTYSCDAVDVDPANPGVPELHYASPCISG